MSAPEVPDIMGDEAFNEAAIDWDALAKETFGTAPESEAEQPATDNPDAVMDRILESVGPAESFRGDLRPDMTGQRPAASSEIVDFREKNIEAALAAVEAARKPGTDTREMAEKTAAISDSAGNRLPGGNNADTLTARQGAPDQTRTPLFKL